MARSRKDGKDARAFLTTLARDVRGNTAMILTASLIPLIGMVGGGVDLSRLYIVKTRLQHACDAGALAGRKTMGGGTWANNNYAARTEANRFFDANFNPDAYGTTVEAAADRRSFSESAGKVTGRVRAIVPMTLMRVFGRTSETLTVECDAEMRLPNTDVMFVLDTTKSMICAPSASVMYCSDAGSGSRMVALRKAVKCFYQIVARLDVADADCEGDEPSGGTGNQVQIRFGFMPYATNVNVGKLLPHAYMADRWTYQSREVLFRDENYYTYPTQGTPSVTSTSDGTVTYGNTWSTTATYTDRTYTTSTCNAKIPADTENSSGSESAPKNVSGPTNSGNPSGSTQTTTWNTTQNYSGLNYRAQLNKPKSGNCLIEQRTRSFTRTRNYRRIDNGVVNTRQVFDGYRYAPIEFNISGLKGTNGAWNSSFTAPVGDTAAGSSTATSATITWDGCIEERETVRTTNFSSIPSGAKDLDVDLVPSSEATRWKPALPRLIFTRRQTSGGSNYNASSWSGTATSSNNPSWAWNIDAQTTTADYSNGISYSCPSEARKLQAWADPSTLQSYVNGLTPDGATYHDIGLLWGARFMSPTGIFSADNATAPNGGEIERHLIFMTDGDTNANDYDYAAYGVPWFDRRQTSANSVPSKDSLDEQVNKRFLAICSWIKNKNITLWVVSFGAAVNADSQDRLEQCATDSDHFFSPDEADDLQSDFKSIADKISQLRLTR